MFYQRQQKKLLIFITLLLTLFLFTGCSTQHVVKPETTEAENATSDLPDEEEAETDPLEGFNRAMFRFNETVDTYLAEPITNVYTFIMPQFVLNGVSNFYSNLNGFNVILNDVLQAKFKQSLSDTGRLALNSTVGLAGLIDVATYAGLDQHDEDFEQTLAVWGVPSGPYLVLPFVGPGTLRGIPGYVVDAAGHPVTYLPIGFAVVGALNRRANAEGSLKFIDEAALDPYVFTRESYLQFREHQIKDGKGDVSDQLSDFDEALFDDELYEDFEDDEEITVQDDLDQEDLVQGQEKTEDEATSVEDAVNTIDSVEMIQEQSVDTDASEAITIQETVKTNLQDGSNGSEIHEPSVNVQSEETETLIIEKVDDTVRDQAVVEGSDAIETEAMTETDAADELGKKPPEYDLPHSW